MDTFKIDEGQIMNCFLNISILDSDVKQQKNDQKFTSEWAFFLTIFN